MVKAKAKQADTSTPKAHAGNGPVKEKLTNKAEAIRRALAILGKKAMPTEIQGFIKTNFGVQMTTQLISVYKSKLTKTKGKPGRKPKAMPATAEVAPKPVAHGGVSFKDLRTMKEIRLAFRTLYQRISPGFAGFFCTSRLSSSSSTNR
jgi:hypothetical protein